MADAASIADARPVSIGRLSREAIEWLADAAAKADALNGAGLHIWISLSADRFVVRGAVGGKHVCRDVMLQRAGELGATNLLLAAVVAVHRELKPVRAPAPAPWRRGRRFS